MAFLRKRASGNYSLVFKWKGKSYIKALSTKDRSQAEQIKQDAEDQLARIRSGKKTLASRILADGHSIVDVLLGCEAIAQRGSQLARRSRGHIAFVRPPR